METQVDGIIFGDPTPWNEIEPDACTTLAEGQSCPLPKDEMATFEFLITVDPTYPPGVKLKALHVQ